MPPRNQNQSITETFGLRPTYLEIDLAQLRRNHQIIQSAIGDTKQMIVLKANAYGHGLLPVAQMYEASGADYFAVAYLEEALLLRENGITTPILVMSGIVNDQLPLFINNDITIAASSVDKLHQIETTAATLNKTARVHLLFDTGMERIGVHYYNAHTLLEASLTCQHCFIEGIFSHFANSDTADLTHARLQLDRFKTILAFYETNGLPHPPLRHIANSGAILQMPEATFDMVRPGILSYGICPSDEIACSLPVKPALTWKSKVVYFKVVKPGHPIGYGSKWESDEMVRVVTLPVGYGDGYMRRMTGNAHVIIRGKRYPVVGGICMDQIMVNIGWDSAYNDDEVILLGTDPTSGAKITVEDFSQWAGTNVYEIMTNINARVPRRYVGEEMIE